MGITQKNKAFFDTLWIEAPKKLVQPLAEKASINLRYINENELTLSIHEATEEHHIDTLIEVFAKAVEVSPTKSNSKSENCLPNAHRRTTTFLTHNVFQRYHAETSMMRYIKSLERKDLALNHSMIALGSCTMKLNAATEMFALSDPQWNNIHPFVPKSQAEGYNVALKELANYLTKITGFGGTSLQPNSGAQGEFAGLLVIQAYHKANNNAHRAVSYTHLTLPKICSV